MLRFIAATGIVWIHSQAYFYPAERRQAVFDKGLSFALFVDLFFVISGFIISAVYADRVAQMRPYMGFIKRRFARLIPLHLLVMAFIVIALLASSAFSTPEDLSPKCIIHNVLLLTGYSRCGTGIAVHGVTWSIGVEFALYLLFPMLLVLMKRLYSAIPVLLAAYALLGWESHASAQSAFVGAIQFSRGLASFLLGMALFQWRGALATISLPSFFVICLLLVTIILMFLGAAQPVILIFIYGTVVSAVCSDMNGNRSAFVTKIAPLGQLTYSIYMWHSLFILIFMNLIADQFLKLGTAPMVAVAVGCYGFIFFWSYLSFEIFETPVRRMIDTTYFLGTVRHAPNN